MNHFTPRKRISFPVFLLSCLFILLLSSCTATSSGPRTVDIAPNPAILRVGISANAPPLIYTQAKTVTGLEAEFAKKLARYTGRQLKFIHLKWEDQIPALENNRIDIIMSGMSITQSRQYRIAFTTPYLRSGQILLVRLGEKARFATGIYSLMNSKYIIGTVRGTTGDLFITKTINGVETKRFQKSSDAVQALIDKKIDAFVYDAPMVCHYAAVNENNKLTAILTMSTEEYYAWGIRRGDTELLDQANSLLRELEEQQELPRMLRTWIPYM